MRIAMLRILCCGTVGCLAGLLEPGSASGDTAQSVGSADTLTEIIVTATKRAENLQAIPLTVSVVSQADVQAQNLVDTSDLKRLIPDLTFQHGNNPGNNSFGMRGISTFALGQGLEQSVGIAFDGVPLARAAGSVADLVDIHSVEALKGPQGMLFGKNASAGLVNIVSNSPELDKTDTTFRVAYGTLNLKEYSGTVNLPVTDDSALRVSAWKFQHDGPVHEVDTDLDMNDKRSDGARLKYRWKPTDALDLNFTGEWTSHDENGTGYTVRFFDPANYTPGNAGALIQAWELAHGTSPSDDNRTARAQNIPYYDKGHTAAYTGQGDYSVGEGTLTAIVSYRNVFNDDQFNAFPTDNPYVTQFNAQDAQIYDQVSEEIHYTSPADERLRYVVGLFNFRLNLRENLGIGLNVYPTPLVVNDNFYTNVKNDNYAGFGEATFDITSQLHVIAGLRRSTDKLYASMDRTFLSPAPAMFPGFNLPGDEFGLFSTSNSTTYNDISWRTGLQYQITPDAMLYVTASKGYKGPGNGYSLNSTQASLAASNNGIVKPEIAHDYEVGFKSQWFDRRLTVNVAVYDEIFDDFQTTLVVPGPTVVLAVENAGQAKSTGVDLDASWLVTSAFSLIGNVTYDDARYTDFKNASCYGGQTLAEGCVGSAQNLDGKRLPNTPKASTGLTARYERPLNDKLRGYLQANYSYRSGVIFSSSEDPLTAQGGYGLVNVNAGVNTTDGRWGISVYGNNVLDKHYVDFISYVTNNVFYTNDIGYEDLQTFGVALTAHF